MGNCLNCEESSEAGEGVDGPLLIQGQKVERFTVAVNPSEPKVILRWDPPTDCDVTDIRAYDVRFKKLGALQYNELQVGAAQTTCTLSLNSGLEPLSSTQFEVRAIQEAGKAGEWTSESLLVDWHCKRTTCGENRLRKYNGQFYDFCGRTCARLYCSRHCMYPSCLLLKEGDNWYCSGHKDEALQSGGGFILEWEQESDKFKSINKNFRKAWPKAKGTAPKIDFVYKIVNPYVSKQFEDYLQGLPHSYRKPAQLYYGTRLECSMADFPELCQSSTCGVCCMSRGKVRQLEAGFCFSASPSRSHDFTSSTGPHRAVLVCKVVTGNRSKMDAGDVNSGSPSPDSIGGRQSGDIVVRNIDAVCPRYIIIYTFP